MTVGERIRQAREMRGLTRPELADLAGIKYPTLAGIENGDQAGSTRLPTLAKVLRVRPEWLETGKGPIEGVEGAPVELSHSARLDVAMIRETVKALRIHEARHGRTFDIESEEGAALFVHWYSIRQQLTDPVTVLDNLIELSTRRDQARAKGAETNGRAESVPTSGVDDRKRSGQSRRGKK